MKVDAISLIFNAAPPITGWVTPDYHADPQGEWGTYTNPQYVIENAYNGTASDGNMAMARVITPAANLKAYGSQWGGLLALFLNAPVLCNKIRVSSLPSNYYGRIELKVKYGGTWHTIYSADPPAIWPPRFAEFPLGGVYMVEGMGFRFERPTKHAGQLICYDFYEGEFWRVA